MSKINKAYTSKILLSTDIGSDTDDALALLAMLNHPEINLKGIYTVNGNVDARGYITKHMLNLAKKNIPIGRGIEKPLGAVVPPYSYGEKYLVDYSFVDEERMREESPRELLFYPLKKYGVAMDGVAHLAQQLSKEKGIIFSIAPMTNIALLQRKYPQAFQNIERLYVIGGSISPDPKTMEHNFRYDTLAAQEVLSSEIPITIIPKEICSQYRLPVAQLEQIDSPPGKYVRRMARANLGCETASAYNSIVIGGEVLSRVLENIVISRHVVNGISLNHQKERLMVNLDQEAAFCDSEIFWEEYHGLISLISNPAHEFRLGPEIAERLRNNIPNGLSIADVYIPYCYLYPEKITLERLTMSSDEQGHTIILPGDKHEVVRDLDYDHFKEFLQAYLK